MVRDMFPLISMLPSHLVILIDGCIWDNRKPEEKPMVFNQDGPCWWCTFIISIGYTMCLNAGTVVWYRHTESHRVLWQWWNSTMDSYETNPIKRLDNSL